MKMKSLFLYIKWSINAHLALVLHLFKGGRDEVWLLGGMQGEVYSDNAKVFHEYLISKKVNIKPVWVARFGSSAYKFAKGEVVVKGSIKNYLYFYNSRIAVFSDTFNHDIAPGVYLLPIPRLFYNKIFKVRLNHGTILFKKRVTRFGISKLLRNNIMRSYDLSTASTELEQSVMISYCKDNSVVLTGSARNDQVIAKDLDDKIILLAPTWRTWLRGSKEFSESEFYRTYSALLSDPRLIEFLRSQNIKMVLTLHHLMLSQLSYFDHLACDVVAIEEQNHLMSEKIIGSELLITDYSSICAERYYLRKPVLFFQFDRARYTSEIGSYIDLQKDSFGLVAETIDQLIDYTTEVFNPDYRISSKQIEGEKYFVHYKDQANCERIYSTIVEKVKRPIN